MAGQQWQNPYGPLVLKDGSSTVYDQDDSAALFVDDGTPIAPNDVRPQTKQTRLAPTIDVSVDATDTHAPAPGALPEQAPATSVSEDVPEAPAAASDASTFTDGTSSEVLSWVDGDKDRARVALSHETSKSTPRKTLVAQLEKVLS
jgi:hypothetical protein